MGNCCAKPCKEHPHLKVHNESGEATSNFVRKFTHSEIQNATLNFHTVTNPGWYDGVIYKSSKPATGIAVTVRKVDLHGIINLTEWQIKVKFIGGFRHPNLVRLIGYCDTEFFLVYEYMQIGSSLDDRLFRHQEPLPWSTRIKIAIDVANALAFLHSTIGVVQGDLKPSNILLDKEFNAKLTDFGFNKLGPGRFFTLHAYFSPELCLSGHPTAKSDIYSFGVVLLELLTGRHVTVTPQGIREVDLAVCAVHDKFKLNEKIDPRLENPYPFDGANKAIALIRNCTLWDPNTRPASVEDVLVRLQEISAATS